MTCKPAPDPSVSTAWTPAQLPSFVPNAADHELLRLRKTLLHAPAAFRIADEEDTEYVRYSDQYLIEKAEPFHKVRTRARVRE